MDDLRLAYDEVYAYTMRRPGFILQHVVDAFAAQTARQESKQIAIVFSLVGLYLRAEKKYSGQDVQKVHMQMGRRTRQWPAIVLPADRGTITAADVLAAPEGTERDEAIDAWCRSVWAAFHESRPAIIALLGEYGIA
jgi:hypothetical protein